jgi:hypothetical protein
VLCAGTDGTVPGMFLNGSRFFVLGSPTGWA